MPSTFTTNYNLEKIADGEQDDTWGASERGNQDRLDDILGGYLSKSVAGSSNVTLTESEYDHRTIELTGTLTGNIDVIFPALQHVWRVYNNTSGAFTLTCKVSGQAGFEAVQGKKYDVTCNGTDVSVHLSDETLPVTGGGTGAVTAAAARTNLGAIATVVEDTAPQLGGALDTNGAAIDESEGSAVASAATTDIWATDGNTVHVTGTTTITSLGTAGRVGTIRRVIFDGILTLTNGANLILPGGANITTAAGDVAEFYADTVTQIRCIRYVKASGEPVVTNANGALRSVQVYTANDTWTKPSGLSRVIVHVYGGGGGAGGSSTTQTRGGGGSGGGYSMKVIEAASLGSSETVTVGAGGAGGAAGDNNGSNGNSSSFGAHCSATGGGHGLAGSGTIGATTQSTAPGAGSGGDINLTGGRGGGSGQSPFASGDGGGCPGPHGGAGQPVSAVNTDGEDGKSFGGGGGGGFRISTNVAGGDGADGAVIVEEYF